MKKILCIYTLDSILCSKEKPIRYSSDIPQGLSYIIAYLKQSGYDCELLVLSQKNNLKKNIDSVFKQNNIDIVLLTSVSSQYGFVKKIAGYIKNKHKEVKIVIGGVHASLNYKDVLRESCFDAVCVGDGEYAVKEYVEKARKFSDYGKIDNMYIKNPDGSLISPDKIIFIQDLDKLPFPEYKIWGTWIQYPNSSNSFYQVLISRGCYNLCSYCSNYALSKISKDNYVRFRKIDSIINEIDAVKKTRVLLNTESAALNINYFSCLADALAKYKGSIEFSCDININKDVLQDEFFKKLDKANIRNIYVGLESGSYKMRQEVLKRPNYTNDDFKLFCFLAKRHNIKIFVYVLVGIPYETQKKFGETTALLRESQPDFIRAYIYTPYPGTDLYNKLFNEKIISNNDFFNKSEERIKAKIAYKNMSKLKIQLNYFLIFWKVYIKHKSLISVLSLTIGNILYSYNRLIPSFLYNFLEKKIEYNVRKLNKVILN